jgi:hypothetical protein
MSATSEFDLVGDGLRSLGPAGRVDLRSEPGSSAADGGRAPAAGCDSASSERPGAAPGLSTSQ